MSRLSGEPSVGLIQRMWNRGEYEKRGCVKTLLFLKNHKALTFTSQGFAMSKSCCNFRP